MDEVLMKERKVGVDLGDHNMREGVSVFSYRQTQGCFTNEFSSNHHKRSYCPAVFF